jgi:four helix bundle protein
LVLKRGYADLKVWSKAMDLAVMVYELGRLMPREERYGMTSQLLRAAASVPANLAEGYQRSTRKDFANFVSIARGSLAETETFLLLATRARLLTEDAAAPALAQADELSRMLTRLRQRLAAPTGQPCVPTRSA